MVRGGPAWVMLQTVELSLPLRAYLPGDFICVLTIFATEQAWIADREQNPANARRLVPLLPYHRPDDYHQVLKAPDRLLTAFVAPY